MRRLIPWILLLSIWAIAWPNLAGSPPNLESTLQAQNERISQDPRDPLAWNDLGNLLVLADRFGEAEQAYRQALALAPGDTAARFNLALLLHQLGRGADAAQELEQLIEIDPYHAWAHYQLGVIHAARKERTQALEHYARAFAYDPALTFAENNSHIIENPLFGEALLLSQRYTAASTARVPRQYGEPSRILGLMLEDAMEDQDDGGEEQEGHDDEEGEGYEGDEDDEDDVAMVPGARTTGTRPSASSAPTRSEEPPPAAAERRSDPKRSPRERSRASVPTQTLTAVGQTQDRTGTTPATPDPDDPRASAPTPPTTVLRRTPPPVASSRAGTEKSPPPPPRASSAPPPTLRRTPPPPTRSSRYIPSRRSTSQLELRFLPLPAEEEAPMRVAGRPTRASQATP